MNHYVKLILLSTLTFPGLFGQTVFSGYVQNWTAYRTGEERNLLLLRNRFRFNTSAGTTWAKTFVSLDINHDQQTESESLEIGLREIYMDVYFDAFDIRIGKQQVIWGKADGVFINDIVNPLDLRYFLMQNFEDIRIGLPMVKLTYFRSNMSIEGIWIPKFEPWKFAETGSYWAFPEQPQNFLLDLGLGIDLPVHLESGDPKMPVATLANSEFGIKLSSFVLSTDLSLLLFHSFQDQAVRKLDNFVMIRDKLGVPDSGIIKLSSEFEKITMLGVNFSRPLGPIVIRGEGSYFKDYRLNRMPTHTDLISSGSSGVNYKSGYVQAMIGADLTGPWGISWSFQYIQKRVLDFQKGTLGVNEHDRWLTLLVSGSFWNEVGNIRMLTIYDESNASGLGRLIFSFKVADSISLESGFDYFWGNINSIFGQFDDNDNIYLKLTYSF